MKICQIKNSVSFHISAQNIDCGYLLVCLFDLGLMSLSTIIQSYRDSVWTWQKAQRSLLECCLTEISSPRHFDMIFHQVTLYWHWGSSCTFLMLSTKRKRVSFLKSLVWPNRGLNMQPPSHKVSLYQWATVPVRVLVRTATVRWF